MRTKALTRRFVLPAPAVLLYNRRRLTMSGALTFETIPGAPSQYGPITVTVMDQSYVAKPDGGRSLMRHWATDHHSFEDAGDNTRRAGDKFIPWSGRPCPTIPLPVTF
jgi:hypothetical protein